MAVTYPEKVEPKCLGEKTIVWSQKLLMITVVTRKITKDDCCLPHSCAARKILKKFQFPLEFTIHLFLK